MTEAELKKIIEETAEAAAKKTIKKLKDAPVDRRMYIPYIIIYAYSMLYHHINNILLPYEWTYAAMAALTAIFCVLFATISSCFKFSCFFVSSFFSAA